MKISRMLAAAVLLSLTGRIGEPRAKLAQEGQPRSPNLELLVTRNIDVVKARPAFAVANILLGTGIPAGVVQVFPTCDSESEINLRVPQGQPVRRVLDALVTANHQYRWTLRDGLVIVSPSAGVPAVLETKENDFRWRGTDNSAPSVPLNSLILMPEIRRRFSDLGLSPGVHQGPGTREVEINPVPRKEMPIDVSLRGLSLMDAFSAIIRTYGRGMWVYTETKCTQDGSTWYLLDSVD